MTIIEEKELLSLSDLVDDATLIHLAIDNRDFNEIQSASPEELLCVDCDLETPLHYAVTNNDVDFCKILVKKQPRLLDMKCRDGNTPFELAVSYKEEYKTHLETYNYFIGLSL